MLPCFTSPVAQWASKHGLWPFGPISGSAPYWAPECTSQGAGWWLWLCFSSFLVLEDFLFCSLFLIPSSLVLFQMFFATFLLAFLCHFRGRGLGRVSTVCHFTRMRSQGQLLTLGDCEKWAVHADQGFKEREMHSQRVGTAKH